MNERIADLRDLMRRHSRVVVVTVAVVAVLAATAMLLLPGAGGGHSPSTTPTLAAPTHAKVAPTSSVHVAADAKKCNAALAAATTYTRTHDYPSKPAAGKQWTAVLREVQVQCAREQLRVVAFRQTVEGPWRAASQRTH